MTGSPRPVARRPTQMFPAFHLASPPWRTIPRHDGSATRRPHRQVALGCPLLQNTITGHRSGQRWQGRAQWPATEAVEGREGRRPTSRPRRAFHSRCDGARPVASAAAPPRRRRSSSRSLPRALPRANSCASNIGWRQVAQYEEGGRPTKKDRRAMSAFEDRHGGAVVTIESLGPVARYRARSTRPSLDDTVAARVSHESMRYVRLAQPLLFVRHASRPRRSDRVSQ